jgi:menaquinone-9 beta-reductase
MTDEILYDVAIVGGGLGGLSLSIQLAKAGYSVILFEKEKYPFHKVCGEYISMESWEHLKQLGLPLEEMGLPKISKLVVSSPSGKVLKSELGLGGFGISRYTIDNELYKLAKDLGVQVLEEMKVNDVVFDNDEFKVSVNGIDVKAKVVAGAFGKRSKLDVKWKRRFLEKKGKLINYLGVKYHVRNTQATDTIALHNFKEGYCGMSKVEADKYCLCYMTTSKNLKENNNSIAEMEKNVLQKNPFLEQIFSESEFLYSSPLTISQISFDKKSAVENHVLMVGDAAGMITPLCGNGMSMALHASKIAYEHIDKYLQKQINRFDMEEGYKWDWNRKFATRMRNGRMIQSVFGKEWQTEMFIGLMKRFGFLKRKIIESTHGEEF